MFKKSNLLPAILASASTLGVLVIGYGILAKMTSIGNNTNNQPADPNLVASSEDTSTVATPAVSFSEPGIVPMGVSIRINGVPQMESINQLLKRSFQKEFPGTTVNIEADGKETGIRLLLSGQIDLVAISRPLNDKEIAQGLAAVAIDGKPIPRNEHSDKDIFSYAYREPANSRVEAFLGHLFSNRGQKVIANP